MRRTGTLMASKASHGTTVGVIYNFTEDSWRCNTFTESANSQMTESQTVWQAQRGDTWSS